MDALRRSEEGEKGDWMVSAPFTGRETYVNKYYCFSSHISWVIGLVIPAFRLPVMLRGAVKRSGVRTKNMATGMNKESFSRMPKRS